MTYRPTQRVEFEWECRLYAVLVYPDGKRRVRRWTRVKPWTNGGWRDVERPCFELAAEAARVLAEKERTP